LSRLPALDKFLFYAFIGLLAWLPLPLGSNRAWAWSIMEIWTSLVSLGWMVLYLLGRVQPTPAFRASWPVLTILGCIVLWVQLQATPLPASWLEALSPQAADIHAGAFAGNTLSLERFASRVDRGLAFSYLQIFALTLLLVNTPTRVRVLVTAVVLGGVFQAIYGAFMTLSGADFEMVLPEAMNRDKATGTFMNHNHMAGYLEMCLALGIGLLVASLYGHRARDWREAAQRFLSTLLSEKARLRIYLTVMVIGLVLTRSRMGNSAFFISLTLASLFWVVACRQLSRGTVLLFASLLLVDIWIVGNFFGFDQVMERLAQTTLEAEQRDEVSIDSLAMIGDYPLVGTGAGSYYAVFPLYQRGEVAPYYEHAHNDYAEFATELGLPAVALLGLGVLLSLRAALKAQLRRRDPFMRGIGFGAGMGLVALLIHSAVDFNLQIPANAALFVVLMALGWISLFLGRRQPGGGSQ
jgi:O-antigen ligase